MFARAGWMAAIAIAAVVVGAAGADAQASAKHDSTAKALPAPGAAAKPVPGKPAKPMTRRQEIQHAIDVRAVPERYRSSVPKEYQKYIPFEKGR